MKNEKIGKDVSSACAWAIKQGSTFELDMILQVYTSGHLVLNFEEKKLILETIAETEDAKDLPDDEKSS